MVDFAYHVHTDVGNQMVGAKVNGKAVHAGHALANAEVVEVLTYDGRPSKGSIARHQVSATSPMHAQRHMITLCGVHRVGAEPMLLRGQKKPDQHWIKAKLLSCLSWPAVAQHGLVKHPP